MKEIDRRKALAGAAAFTAGAFAPVRAFADDKPMGAWTPLANMPFPVQEIYPAPFRKSADPGTDMKPKPFDLLVNAGGLTPETEHRVTDKVTFYDPSYDAWGFATPLIEPRHHIALVNNNGFLYGVGGFARDARGGWMMRANAWRLKSLNGAWETLEPLPHPQAEAATVSLGGFIHMAGGRSPAGSRNLEWADHIDTDEHWYYDAGDNRWRSLAPIPTARNSTAGVAVNGVFYVIGGRTVSDGNTNAVEVYDPLSDRWEKARPMPKAQGGIAAAVLNGKIYVFGGEYAKPAPGVFPEAWEYDPDTDKWRAVAAMPRPRHGHGAVTLGNAIYVLGGGAQYSGRETSAALDKFEI